VLTFERRLVESAQQQKNNSWQHLQPPIRCRSPGTEISRLFWCSYILLWLSPPITYNKYSLYSPLQETSFLCLTDSLSFSIKITRLKLTCIYSIFFYDVLSFFRGPLSRIGHQLVQSFVLISLLLDSRVSNIPPNQHCWISRSNGKKW
jgi:hypothetical protein